MKTAAVLSGLMLMSLLSIASMPIIIERQGEFSVGGTPKTRLGTFDSGTFIGWTNSGQDGQTNHRDNRFDAVAFSPKSK